MNTSDIRQLFTRFFEDRGHRRIPSSSLIPPPEERTLLFTNAGMNQMKPYFMGLAEPPSRRLTTIQKCFRTSDIEEVGDGSHHTFFEMLGNFSVGDYFKPEIIPWAWELLTDRDHGLGLQKERLWTTIFREDEEAHDLWRAVGVPEERIVRYGEKDNYWFMGRVGPCGPNTEINYDFGEYEGWRPHACHPNCEEPDCRRYLELWNLVFMTLFQDEDGSRRPLPQRNVDTGAGLERWPSPVLWERELDWQGKPKRWTQPPTNYDSDAFQTVISRVGEMAGVDYYESGQLSQRAMRIVAEHSRAATFLIADGVQPSNEGRGYVLRRLIRRGVFFSKMINLDPLEFVAESIIQQMGNVYPELQNEESSILAAVRGEREAFSRVIDGGNTYLSYRLNYAKEREELADTDVPVNEAEEEALDNFILNRIGERIGLPTNLSFAELGSFRRELP